MTRYQLRQKLFAFGDDYFVKDARGRDVYFVDGRAFSFGAKLSFQDLQKKELAFIEQKVLAWGRTFDVWRDGKHAARVKKEVFTLFKARFTVDVPGPDDLEAEGSFWELEYTFKRGSRVVATVSKRFFDLKDTYGIDIADGEDDVLLLCAAVVIDQCCHEGKRG